MTYLARLIGKHDLTLTQEELLPAPEDYRSIPEQHAEAINLLLTRLITECTEVEEQIERAKDRHAQLETSIRAFNLAAEALSETQHRATDPFDLRNPGRPSAGGEDERGPEEDLGRAGASAAE